MYCFAFLDNLVEFYYQVRKDEKIFRVCRRDLIRREVHQ